MNIVRKGDRYPIASLPEEKRKALLDSVLDRALNGEKQADIAESIGIHQTRLSQLLLRYAEDDWKSVQVARALAAVDKCDEDIEIAPDSLSLARARERQKSAMWQLERLHRRLFGQDQQVSSGAAVQINIGIVRRPEQDNGQTTANVLIEQDK